MDPSIADQRPLRILIADDSDSDRLILKTLVKRLGHDVFDARDGEEAVRLFEEAQPDIVLLDALMPVMDGMEAARRIKALAGERLVPLIFLTSLSEAGDLARCLDAGGDDFLSKPYNRVLLEAKINAFNRMRRMHETLSGQRDHIRELNQQLLREQEIAKRVFDNVAHTGCLDAFNIRYLASPLSVFNGDVLFASPRPAGGMLIFVGDFTGHGLPAAIGAMPLAEIFYGMAAKGFSAKDVLREINRKLKQILPTGMFCCGAMIEAVFHENQLWFWNGGLPDAQLIRANGDNVALPSRHLPLGILSPDQFNADLERVTTEPGDSLMLMTDGVLESSNRAGEVFGDAGVARALETRTQGLHPFDAVIGSLREFTGSHQDSDDITLFCVDMVDDAAITPLPDRTTLPGPAEWHCEYELRERTLGDFNPLPLLLHICMEVPGLRSRSGEIYTVLAELYNNALEHGILELPSDWKHSPEGFGKYYRERQVRLGRVDGHFIRFSLSHSMKPYGGRLRVVCEDSGSGFDFKNHPVSTAKNTPSGPLSDDPVIGTSYAGRGLMLLRQLSESLSFHGRGNRIEIVYDWDYSDAPLDHNKNDRH
ncbi:fused response regulator/phosphatase [Marinobacter sp. chi1]|uniref:Fused response regulator/phosphatase n=1 Tax=Marinobacter suaedae TaxID=3057675 RepID=A0ABT8VW77_9GAMM|nr:fused response regulator/phosphatase [Marinobacter sp. chi1]MDO3720241.1 fused response regulator/phosphatase [Marinobacter sp. chi1]